MHGTRTEAPHCRLMPHLNPDEYLHRPYCVELESVIEDSEDLRGSSFQQQGQVLFQIVIGE